MKLRDDFLAELRNLISQPPQTVFAVDGVRSIKCDVEQCDALSAAVTVFSLQTAELASTDIAKLQAASQALCQRVTYLLEPISPIEIDATGCVVQMRSNPPQRDDNGLKYYELTLRQGGSVSLYRYEKQPGNARAVVSATLTHEVLARLVDDFNQAVEEVIG